MRILLCGGAGYIGAHTYVVLVERGHDVVVADNFSNSSPGVLARLRQITGRPVPFQPLDLAPDAKAIWLEIGFGGGEHMAAQAGRNPETLVIGAEPFVNGVASAVHRESPSL